MRGTLTNWLLTYFHYSNPSHLEALPSQWITFKLFLGGIGFRTKFEQVQEGSP